MKTILNKNSDGYGYKYTDLSEIHKYLEENKIRYMQKIERIDGDDYIFTRLCVDGEWEKEWYQGCRVVQATLQGIKNPAQEQGSALTYARRYSLLMTFGLATDDDDAQSLSVSTIQTKEDAEKVVIDFGKKHPGKTLKEIMEVDESYIEWLRENTKQNYIKEAINLIKPLPNEEDQAKTLELMTKIKSLSIQKMVEPETICEKFGVEDIKDMTIEQMKKCVEALEKK